MNAKDDELLMLKDGGPIPTQRYKFGSDLKIIALRFKQFESGDELVDCYNAELKSNEISKSGSSENLALHTQYFSYRRKYTDLLTQFDSM